MIEKKSLGGMKMQNDKILPCPCCASEIKGGVQLTGFGYVNKQFIECDACGLKMERKYLIDNMSQSHLKAITRELITRWNTRKPMERIVEQLSAKIEKADKMTINEASINGHSLDYECFYGQRMAYIDARQIVKGGVNNAEE